MYRSHSDGTEMNKNSNIQNKFLSKLLYNSGTGSDENKWAYCNLKLLNNNNYNNNNKQYSRNTTTWVHMPLFI